MIWLTFEDLRWYILGTKKKDAEVRYNNNTNKNKKQTFEVPHKKKKQNTTRKMTYKLKFSNLKIMAA